MISGIHAHADLRLDTPLSDIARLVRQGWLSPGAVSVTEAIGRLDPAEGVGILAWLVEQLGSSRVDSSSQSVMAQWLLQLSNFAAQTAMRLQNPKSG